jgi:hypothetical protein
MKFRIEFSRCASEPWEPIRGAVVYASTADKAVTLYELRIPRPPGFKGGRIYGPNQLRAVPARRTRVVLEAENARLRRMLTDIVKRVEAITEELAR